MELEGVKWCFFFFKLVGISVFVFILDWYRGIVKWIRECKFECLYYFDIWYIVCFVGKVMLKLVKEKGCEKIGDWIKGVRNYFYWCVIFIKFGYVYIIVVKWKLFMRYVINKYDGYFDKEFEECVYGDIGSWRWIKIGEEKVLLYL